MMDEKKFEASKDAVSDSSGEAPEGTQSSSDWYFVDSHGEEPPREDAGGIAKFARPHPETTPGRGRNAGFN